ncbi:MAG: NADH-quinone oxidoreductase subunit M [Chloroflexi bacterium]|nr:NADH-quinone oxidoreductase subunit M [Chloroflexota bacterium]
MPELPYLTIIIFLPVVGALAVVLQQTTAPGRAIKLTAALFSFLPLVLSFILFLAFDSRTTGLQFVEKYPWIPRLGVNYFLAVDGLSLPLVLLTALLGFLAILASWKISLRIKEYFAWLLLLETGVLGVFASLDFLLFFLFWEVELVPMYMLISIWGSGRKVYSATKFVIYTLTGSAFMLVGLLALYFSTGTFDLVEMSQHPIPATVLPATAIFFLIFFAFAVKLPVFPLHTWLPDAHTDAPTAVSVILAGVLLKMGGYAMIRINLGLFPEVISTYAPLLATLGVVNVLYGAAVTLLQQDLKRMIAYSSISHMGYVLLGISALNPVGLTGAALQMFTHGTITGLLFLLVGLVYDKAHTRQIPELGGLSHRMPVIGIVFVVAGLASLGLPTMSGFVAEMLVFLGTFPVWNVATVLAAFGIVLTAGYMLWMLQRSFFGPLNPRHASLADADALERIPLFSLVGVIVIIGVYPAVMTNVIATAIPQLLNRLGG